jgi:hypothetical protein
LSSEVNIVIRATDEASRVIADAGNSITTAMQGVSYSAVEVTDSYAQYNDALSASETAQLENVQAANQLKDAQDNLKTASKNLSDAVREYGTTSTEATAALREYNSAQKEVDSISQQLGKSQRDIGASVKDLVVGFSGVATSAFALYNAYDNVKDMEVSLDRANLQVQSSANSLTDAQNRQVKAGGELEAAHEALAQAIENYGENSAQAAKAQGVLDAAITKYKGSCSDVEVAQERYNVSVERADMVQGNLNETMVRSALTVIPSLITMVSNLSSIYDKLKGSSDGAATSVGGLNTNLGTTTTTAQGTSTSSSNLASTLGMLSIAVAGVGTSITLANGQIDQMNQKGMNLNSTERVLYDGSMMLGQGIGVSLGQALMNIINPLDQTDKGLQTVAQHMTELHATNQNVIDGMAQLGYSAESINTVLNMMANSGAANAANSTANLASQANAAAAAFSAETVAANQAAYAANQAALATQTAITAQQEYIAGTPKTGAPVPVYQHGGIAWTPQMALIAEEEPELIIPLSRIGASAGPRGQPTINVNIHPFIHIGNVSQAMDLKKVREALTEEIVQAVSDTFKRQEWGA